ncbi:hypothetical protein GCM10009808_07590 [Microbacterium sediminicola]|uniref:DUF4878 domain-containing protein n=2 Tax=Microbacterium sediminicola TaxID=415210 RepID=A0ABP4TT74_9MICO
MVGYAPLRRVRAAESPYPGVLVRVGTGTRLLIDPDQQPRAGVFWEVAEESHVLRAREVVQGGRLPEGAPQALVEICAGPLRVQLGSLGRLTPSQLATVFVALLRGSAEMARSDDAEAPGEWWMTGSGRPVFALGDTGTACAASACALIAELDIDDAEMRALGDTVAGAISTAANDSSRLRCEQRIFATVAPAALIPVTGTASMALRTEPPVRDLPPSLAGDAEHMPEERRNGPAVTSGMWGAAMSREVRDMADEVLARVRRRRRSGGTAARPRRRRVVLGALGLAAVVAVAALLLLDVAPEGAASSGGAAAENETPGAATGTPTSVDGEGETAADGMSHQPATPEEITAIAAALLDAWTTCGEDVSCRSTIAESPDLGSPGGAAVAPVSSLDLTLIDDFGDVAVVGATEAGAETTLIVVLARPDGEWLLRDVYGVAQQPG